MLVRHVVQGPFDEAIETVNQVTGLSISKRSAETITAPPYRGPKGPYRSARKRRIMRPRGESRSILRLNFNKRSV
jgi:hypothetical protein